MAAKQSSKLLSKRAELKNIRLWLVWRGEITENVYPPVPKYKGEKWRGECIKCRAVWFSETEPKKCPNCGMDRNLMKDIIRKAHEK